MIILCAITGLIKLVLLVALTGILASFVAVSRLMEVSIGLIHPCTIFLLRQSGKLVVLEIILTDLSAKFPCLQYVLQSQYAPYLNTAGTVLLGWLIVSWISYVVWALLAPLTITVIAIILLRPIAARWCFKQTLPGFKESLDYFTEKCQVNFSGDR